MRTFVAIELPDALQTRLGALQETLQFHLPASSVRWTTPEKLHLTLRFLGETSNEQRQQLATGLLAIVRDQQDFPLVLEGLGCFPYWRRPRVVWVGMAGALSVLQQLQAQVEDLAQQSGFSPDTRDFSPHITIGRAARRSTSSNLRIAGEALQTFAQSSEMVQPLGRFTVEQLVHMQSQLSPTGSRYTPLRYFPFGPSSSG